MDDSPVLFVVDEDQHWLTVCQNSLEDAGYRTRCFLGVEPFLYEVPNDAYGVLVADFHLPGVSSAALQQRMMASHSLMSLVVVLTTPDVASAVMAMERGAVTVLEKPFSSEHLIQSVNKAIKQARPRGQLEADVWCRWNSLSDEERRVMQCVASGMPNKRMALCLKISSRTLDRRRASVMDKMQVESTAELARIWEQFGGFGFGSSEIT